MTLAGYGVNYETVTGTFLDMQGNPMSGDVRFQPSFTSVLVSQQFNRIIGKSNFTAALDVTGAFSISLPATNDTDLTPVGFTYKVIEPPGSGRVYNMPLPVGSGPFDLSDAVPTGQASPGVAVLVPGRGIESIEARDGLLIFHMTDGTDESVPFTGFSGGGSNVIALRPSAILRPSPSLRPQGAA